MIFSILSTISCPQLRSSGCAMPTVGRVSGRAGLSRRDGEPIAATVGYESNRLTETNRLQEVLMRFVSKIGYARWCLLLTLIISDIMGFLGALIALRAFSPFEAVPPTPNSNAGDTVMEVSLRIDYVVAHDPYEYSSPNLFPRFPCKVVQLNSPRVLVHCVSWVL